MLYFCNNSIDNFTILLFSIFFLSQIHIFLTKDGRYKSPWNNKIRWSFGVNEFEQGNKRKKRKERLSLRTYRFWISFIVSFMLNGLYERIILLLFVVNHVSSYKSSQSHGGEHPSLFSVTLEQIVRWIWSF